MHYRNTTKENPYSPTQLLMSISIRTKLPVKNYHVKPKNKINFKTDKITHLYCKKTKILKPLKIGNKVLFKLVTNGPWVSGKIVEIGMNPRSYIIERGKGRW